MFERKEIDAANQTEFVDQAQFLEKKSFGLFNLQNIKKNKNLLPFFILAFCIFFLFLIIILKVVFKEENVELEQNKEITEETQSDPLLVRVEELKEDLKTHNPTKQSLPFPEVDLEFNIN